MENGREQRVDRTTGLGARDLTNNPLAIARREREAQQRSCLNKEAQEPWTRAKVEAEISRSAGATAVPIVNGAAAEVVRYGTNFHGADLSRLDLSGLDLSRANLHGANLSETNLRGCRLVGANLYSAVLENARLEDANAVEANFHRACLCRSKVHRTHFMRANLSKACHEATEGLALEEKPLTPAEGAKANRYQGDRVRAHILVDEGKVLYYGDTLFEANILEMSAACKTRSR